MYSLPLQSAENGRFPINNANNKYVIKHSLSPKSLFLQNKFIYLNIICRNIYMKYYIF